MKKIRYDEFSEYEDFNKSGKRKKDSWAKAANHKKVKKFKYKNSYE